MTLFYRSSEQSITVMGQTYPHKELIKKFGGVFVPGRKVWRLPYSDSSLEQVRDLCVRFGGGAVGGEDGASSPGAKQASAVETPLIKPEELEKEPVVKPSKDPGLSIEQLYSQIDKVLKKSFAKTFWLIGEVESVAYRKSAVYVTLVEKNERGLSLSVNAVIWQGQLREMALKHGKETLKDLLQEGLSLCVACQLNFYKGRGQISLQIKDLNPSYTKGALALEKEHVIKQLKSSGLYDLNKKKQLSRFPFRIGLITAEGSRAYSDFCHQLMEKNFGTQVFFVSSSMQGLQTAASLKKAFLLLKEKNCDLLVLTRGGGSASDLRVFDSLEVAKLVAEAQVPVLAAIGHHEDSCVAEEVCFQYLKTPTAAAEYILRHFEQGFSYLDYLAIQMTKVLERQSEQLLQKNQTYELRMNQASENFFAKRELYLSKKDSELLQRSAGAFNKSEKTSLALEGALFQTFVKALHKKEEKLSFLFSKLEKGSNNSIVTLSMGLEKLRTKITALDPRPWLKAGWTRLYNKEGVVVKSIESLELKDKLEAQLIDGRINLDLTGLKKKEGKSL